MLFERIRLKAQIRDWQRTLDRLEDKIVDVCDEIAGYTEKEYEHVAYLRDNIKHWNESCEQLEAQIDEMYKQLKARKSIYKMRMSVRYRHSQGN